jgi:Rha family phage regulatory protein
MTDSEGHTYVKRHKNVLQAYDNLQCSSEFNRLNFQSVEYVDHKGELRRMIKMTKDGFMLLVMGFSGEVARWRWPSRMAYIAAFNALAA